LQNTTTKKTIANKINLVIMTANVQKMLTDRQVMEEEKTNRLRKANEKEKHRRKKTIARKTSM
jgi:hypothetical protein